MSYRMNTRYAYQSLVAWLAVSALLVARFVSDGFQDTIKWDVAGYYMYLPQTFIQGDIGIRDYDKLKSLNEQYEFSPTLYQVHHNEQTGCYVIQYTCGMSLLYLPAFAVAHGLALANNMAADGYSPVYATSLGIWSLCLAIAGVYFLRKALLQQFGDTTAAISVFLACLGMNFYMQVSKSLASPHTFLFALYAMLLYFTIRWHKEYRRSHLFTITAILALLCLCRPTEMLAVLIPVFWNVRPASMRSDLKIKFHHIGKDIYPALALLIAMGSIQLIYWKITSGSFLHMSYSNPGEGFDFTHPHTVNFLFSFRKGWFIYTPLSLLLFPSLWILYRNYRPLLLPFLAFFLSTIFIASLWTCWWYAQCFSQRTMVQSLPLLAFLFAFVVDWIASTARRRWIGGIAIASLFVLSLFYQWQYLNGIISSDRMTAAYFKKIFLKTEKDPAWDDLLLIPRSFDGIDTFNASKYLKVHDWNKNFTDTTSSGDTSFFILHHAREFSPPLEFKYGDLTSRDHLWFRFSGIAKADTVEAGDVLRVVMTAMHNGGVYGYTAIDLPADSLIQPHGFHFQYQYLTPEMRSAQDQLSFYCWYVGHHHASVANFHLEAYERKLPGE